MPAVAFVVSSQPLSLIPCTVNCSLPRPILLIVALSYDLHQVGMQIHTQEESKNNQSPIPVSIPSCDNCIDWLLCVLEFLHPSLATDNSLMHLLAAEKDQGCIKRCQITANSTAAANQNIFRAQNKQKWCNGADPNSPFAAVYSSMHSSAAAKDLRGTFVWKPIKSLPKSSTAAINNILSTRQSKKQWNDKKNWPSRHGRIMYNLRCTR